VRLGGKRRVTRTQVALGAATVLAYSVGYPLAIIGNESIGWVLVMIGGLLLLGFGMVTVLRIHRGSSGE
jgi:hypothetical protein